jgi:CheY-like chemotaxis protein
VFGTDDLVVQTNAHAAELLSGDPMGRKVADFLPSTDSGLGVPGMSLAGDSLVLDVATVELLGPGGDHLRATYLRDAGPRVQGEAVAAHFRESQVRRRQALELNDSVIQGLTASILAMQAGDDETSSYYLGSTLISARRMMNEWLAPLEGTDLEPGDLIRSAPSTIGDAIVTELPARVPTRILLVDDNEDVRRLLRLKIEDNTGYEVIGEAADGEQAVELAATLQPNVVVLDLAMPKMDGLQALPLILEAVTNVRVIVLSGFDEASMAERAFQAGAHAYLEKGLRMDLDGAIKTVLKESA